MFNLISVAVMYATVSMSNIANNECDISVDIIDGRDNHVQSCADDGFDTVARLVTASRLTGDVTWCVTRDDGTECYENDEVSLDLIMATVDVRSFCKDNGGAGGGSCWKQCGAASCKCSDHLGIGFNCFCFTGTGTKSDLDNGQNITGWGTVCNN